MMSTQNLPTFQILAEALRVTFGANSYLVRLAWLPLLFFAGATMALTHLIDTKETASDFFSGLFPVLLLYAVAALFVVSASVRWHQYVIRGTILRGVAPSLKWAKEGWPYFVESGSFFVLAATCSTVGVLLGFFLVSIIDPSISLANLKTLDPFSPVRLVLAVIVVALSILPIILYLLVLPSVAIGKRLSFNGAKEWLRGNVLRLWLVWVCIATTEIIISGVVGYILTQGEQDELGLTSNLAGLMLSAVFYVIGLSAVASAYRWFEQTYSPQPSEAISESY